MKIENGIGGRERRINMLSPIITALMAAGLVAAVFGNVRNGDGKEIARELALRKPTGPYRLGTTVFRIVDETRKDPFAADPAIRREWMVQVWYPAKAIDKAPEAPYLSDPGIAAAMKKLGYLDGLDPTFIERWKSVRTHAFLDIPLIALPTRLPLLLFSPGFGVSRSNYTVLMEELASHGFIVAAIDHPYGGVTILPGGRILTIREDPGPPAMTNLARIDMMTKDASKVLDVLLGIGSKVLARFAGRIDTERIGAIGHSLGGAVALEAGRKDTRVKACIDLDGDVWADTKTYRLARPSLILLNEPIIESPSDAFRKMQAARKADWAALAQANPEFPPDVFTIRGTNHFVFTDGPFVMPDFVRAQPGKLGDLGEAVNSIMALVRGFFDVQLNGKPSPLLGDPSRVYPEVKRYVERTGLRL